LSGFLGKGNLKDGEESLLPDSHKTLLFWLIDINNLLLSDLDDLVKATNLATNDFCDPECLVHKFLSCFDGDVAFAFSEEECEGARNILAWIRVVLP
jgi:hypothetical protein